MTCYHNNGISNGLFIFALDLKILIFVNQIGLALIIRMTRQAQLNAKILNGLKVNEYEKQNHLHQYLTLRIRMAHH
jgi:hypothetical protein